MRIALFVLVLLAGLGLFSVVSFSDGTQQYSKIYLNPFYVNSIGAGSSVSLSVNLNPPDRISSVVSAIVGFNAQINGQTQNFTLRVNGQACNPSSYSVATAFSTTGNVQFYFDCTNAVTQAGNYKINLTSSVATGAITGWLEVTYMNNPSGDMKIFGTEYNAFDTATMFLQLLDANSQPKNTATCSLNIYYPDKTIWKSNVTMTYLPTAEGLYYYDVSLSSIAGVYMASATCAYPVDSKIDNFVDFSKILSYNNVTISGGILKLNDSIVASCSGTASTCSSFSSNATCSAQSGCAWNTTNPTWLSNTFYNCSNVTLKNAGSATLSNFAYYINVSKTPEMLSNYTDLRFYSGGCGEGGAVLPYEIENYTSSSATVWVQIPTLFTPTTTISMYYNNISAVGSGQNVSQVWDSRYVAVWHLSAGSNTTARDSTINNINASPSLQGFPTATSGAIGNALMFNLPSVLYMNSTLLDLTTFTNWTISAWVKPTNYSLTDYPTIYSYGIFRDSIGLSSATGGADGRIEEWVNFGTGNVAVTPANFNAFNYVTLIRNRTRVSVYINGKLDASWNSVAITNANLLSAIGNPARNPVATAGTIEQFIGAIDEVSVSNVRRSENWVNQTYQMVINQSNYVTFTPVTSVVACVGTATVCSAFSSYPTCQAQQGCSFTNASSFLSGNVKSIPLNLSVNQTWKTFTAAYDVQSGAMSFSILNSTNHTVCTSLGDVSSCANSYSPVYLVATLNRTSNFSTSPELDQWTLGTIGNSSIVELRGSGEIHVSSMDTKPYLLTTNCGDTSPACAVTDNAGGFEGGQAYDTITVTSLTPNNIVNTTINWTYDTPSGVDCTAFLSLQHWNGTAWNDISANATISPISEHDYCSISVPLTLLHDGVDIYNITYSNYVYWEIYWSKALVDAINKTYAPFCDQLALENEYFYYVPITNETVLPSDVNLAYCYRFADDRYWYYYYQSQAAFGTTIGEQSIILTETKFYRNKFYDDVAYFNGLNTIQGFAAVQLSLNALPEIQAQYVWNYTTRNLTYYPIMTVNESLIAEAVWNASVRTLTDYNLSGIEIKLDGLNATLMDIIGYLSSINLTSNQNLAYLISLNITSSQNSAKLDQVLAIVTDANTTVYANNALLSTIYFTTGDTYTLLTGMNNTLGNTYQNTNSIIATLYNLSVGNISVSANVNVSEIVEGVLGADVQQFVITAQPTLAAPAEITGMTAGVAYAMPAANGVTAICGANDTLTSTLTLVRCVNNQCNTIVSNTTEVCQYGCVSDVVPNVCASAPSQVNVLFIIIVIIAVLFLAGGYLWFRNR